MSERALPRGLARILRLPLFYKLLIANGGIVVGVAAGCRWVTTTGGIPPEGAILPFAEIAAAGVVAILAVNAALVWLALSPLRSLQEAAQRVHGGDFTARAPHSSVADQDTGQLIETFNAVIDTVAAHRRRMRDVSARSQLSVEDERKRVARELHDGIAQELAALRVRLRLARVAPDRHLREQILEDVGDGIGDAIEELRRVARGLRPPALEMLGLATAIESYARPVAEAAGMAVDLVAEDVSGLMPPETELALYRVLQEALSNIVRHSGAASVRIRMHRDGAGVRLSIRDDGKGFDVGRTGREKGGLGLFGMEERAAAVGGRLDIVSARGRGTRVDVLIPIGAGVHA